MRILKSNQGCIPPFVVQLLGEHVIEILQVIDDHREQLDSALYAQFLRANPAFLALTEKRVFSYWDCYYRSKRKEEYVGFRVLNYLKALTERNL